MIPSDLAGFSAEQLRGFSTAIKLSLESLKPEAKGDADKLAALETLLEDRDRVQSALATLLEGDEGDDASDGDADKSSEAGEADGDATSDEDSDSDDDAEADKADAEKNVDEAVASAKLKGSAVKSRVEVRESRTTDIQKFMRHAASLDVRSDHRSSFTTMLRETNQRVGNGADATAAILAARDGKASDKAAAGCFCGPDDARNEIKYSAVTDRPFSDTLPTITASGDFRFIRQIPITDALTGTTLWTCADQDDVDPSDIDTWKPCFSLDCQNEVTSDTYAVSACATFNLQAMIGNPALIDNLEHVMQVAYNRVAELQAYAKVLAQASQYTYGLSTAGYGASAQLLAAVSWAVELIRQNQRDLDGYNLVLPAGTRERVLGDGEIRASDDYRTWDDVQTRLSELGINTVVELVDPLGPVTALAARGGPAVAAPAHEVTRQILLYRPDDYVLALNGEVDLGIQRSPELAKQNKLQWFSESFEAVERVGVAPTVSLDVELCLNGIRPAYGEGEDCVADLG